jgi:hypothetical protein
LDGGLSQGAIEDKLELGQSLDQAALRGDHTPMVHNNGVGNAIVLSRQLHVRVRIPNNVQSGMVFHPVKHSD